MSLKTKEQTRAARESRNPILNLEDGPGRQCIKCGQFKILFHFHKRNECQSGYKSECKECRKIEKKEYRKKNLTSIRIKAQLYNHKIRTGGGLVTPEEWLNICEKYRNKCLACGEVKPLTIDLIIPVTKGGKFELGNIQPLCQSCNTRKMREIIDYRIYGGNTEFSYTGI